MDEKRKLLCHFLAALAYRTQKALRDAPSDFGSFRAAEGIRTPVELIRHMTGVLGYGRTFFIDGQYKHKPLPSFQEEILYFHEMIKDLAGHIENGAPMLHGMSPERLLQGPFSDAMTHAGQLALLRRLAGAPVAPENFVLAEIDGKRLGPEQSLPASPDNIWPEAPQNWLPPSGK